MVFAIYVAAVSTIAVLKFECMYAPIFFDRQSVLFWTAVIELSDRQRPRLQRAPHVTASIGLDSGASPFRHIFVSQNLQRAETLVRDTSMVMLTVTRLPAAYRSIQSISRKRREA